MEKVSILYVKGNQLKELPPNISDKLTRLQKLWVALFASTNNALIHKAG